MNTMDELGLGFLDSVNLEVQPIVVFPSISLINFATSSNPFQNETTLYFTLNRMSFIQLTIYDELGRLVWGDGRGSSVDAGEHTVHIDSSLPSGTLYARISTGFGEVKTLKLVHESSR